MIIKLKKILVYGLEKELSDFFEKAQEEGYVEFIGPSSKKMKELPSSLKKYVDAIKILKKQPLQKFKLEGITFNADEVCDRIIQADINLAHLEELRRNLEDKSLEISPLGDFSERELEFIKNETNYIFQFFTIRSKRRKNIPVPDDLIYIGSEYDLDYFVSITKEKRSYPGYVEVLIEMPISVIKKRIEMVDEQIEVQKDKLKSYSPYMIVLKDRMYQKYNFYNLEIAKKDSKKTLENQLFSIEAWVPSNKIDDLKKLIDVFSVDFSEISIETQDREPTYMQNKGVAALGEDLVNIYDTPSINDKDPSEWVFWFFALFFAMIIGDAGYGLIFLALALFLKFKIKNPKPSGARFIRLMLILSTCCILWGVVTASFFGIQIKPFTPITRVSIVQYLSEKKADYHLSKKDDVYKKWLGQYPKIAEAKNGKEFLSIAQKIGENNKVSYEALDAFNKNILLEFSILVGVIHIIIALSRNLKNNLAGIGWCIFLIGGYLYFPLFLQVASFVNYLNILPKETAYFYGQYLVFIGIAVAVLLALIEKKLGGLLEVTNVVGVCGDVLSYLRLYALAMAGMMLSETCNDMARSVPLFVGIFILILGHGINIALAIMGGVIHGLRLNFLEWYHHCFEGGGRIFNPLKIIK